jgi:plastocyanin
MRQLIAAGLLLVSASPAVAGTLVVRVVDGTGRPINDAVVTIDTAGVTARPARLAGPYRIEQRDMQFNPFVSVVPVGATVFFPIFDATRHHVYSFSPAKRFELKLFARDQSRSVRFDKAGIIAIGCNIHDQMSAFLFVTASNWAQRTERGTATFRDAPSGQAKISVWHPYLRAPSLTVSRMLPLGAGNRVETFAVKLRPPPLHNMDSY